VSNLPVPVPRTFGVQEYETAAYLNAVRDALNFLLNPPVCRVYQATTQSCANATNVAITYDASTVDTYGGHSNSTNNSRYVAQVPGWYLPGGVIAINATSTTLTTWGYLAKNGSQATPILFAPSPLGGNNRVWFVAAEEIFLNTGDYVEIYVNQNDGSAKSTVASATQFSTMFIQWEHA
jgi:hypothetical protein